MALEQNDIKMILDGVKDLLEVELETKFEVKLAPINEQLEHIELSTTKTQLTIENEIRPNIQLLFEGYTGLTETVNEMKTDINRLNKMESDVAATKTSVKEMKTDINRLDKMESDVAEIKTSVSDLKNGLLTTDAKISLIAKNNG